MAKNKKSINYDSVLLELVPKIVDTNPKIFKDDSKYWDYSVNQVYEFLGRLPENYTGEVIEERFQKEKAALFECNNPPYDLLVGFKPAYNLLIISPNDKRCVFNGDDCIACPTFDIGFKLADEVGVRRIIKASLDQFFLRQGDIDDGTLMAFGLKNKKVVQRDLEVLTRFLPKGTVIEARCDYGTGNGQVTYRL